MQFLRNRLAKYSTICELREVIRCRLGFVICPYESQFPFMRMKREPVLDDPDCCALSGTGCRPGRGQDGVAPARKNFHYILLWLDARITSFDLNRMVLEAHGARSLIIVKASSAALAPNPLLSWSMLVRGTRRKSS